MSGDLRAVGFAEVRDRLTGNCLKVHAALSLRGPSTCSELAAAMGWPVTSVRPRVTQLVDLFHAQPTGIRRNHEHEFRALSAAEAKQLHDAAKSESEFKPEPAENPNQLHLAV